MVVPPVANLTCNTVAIIGCGNANRCDDGVGPAVIDLLQSEPLPPGVSLYDAGTDGMSVMYRARGMSRLIIIDAKMPEHSPGAIFKVPGEVLQSTPPHSLNLHDFRWDHALYAGRKIYTESFPADVDVFLIEAKSLQLGIGLTPEVREAAQVVAAKIRELLIDHVQALTAWSSVV